MNRLDHDKSKYLFLGVFLVACGIAGGSLWKVFVEKSEYREMYKGNVGTELESYTAGLNFARHGFAKLYFLPAINRYEESLGVLMKQGLYTHFPPGPDLMSGVLQEVGVHGFYQQKICLLLVNLTAMLLLALVVRRLVPQEQGAPLVFAALAMTSVWFVWWAGNLHEHAYDDLFMASAVWATITRKEKLYLLVCFMAMLFSFQPVPWLSVLGAFVAIQNMMAKRWSFRRALLFLVAMLGIFFLAFAIHFCQNAYYFHSFSSAFADFRAAYQRRVGETGTGVDRYNVAKHLVKGAYASLWFYGTGVLILAGIGAKAAVKKRCWLPVVLLLAGFAWPIAFRQHSMIHAFTWLHLGIGLFLLATIGFLHLWEQTKCKKFVALLLLFGAMLRLPLGCEISNNPFLLRQLHKAVVKTDSATIADLIYFFKDNPEHAQAKMMLVDELALRAHALPDQPAYIVVINGKPVTLVRDEQGHSIWYRNLPEDRTPVFHDSVFPYLDATGARNEIPGPLRNLVEPRDPLSRAGTPTELIVAGDSNRGRYHLLLAYLLLQ